MFDSTGGAAHSGTDRGNWPDLAAAVQARARRRLYRLIAGMKPGRMGDRTRRRVSCNFTFLRPFALADGCCDVVYRNSTGPVPAKTVSIYTGGVLEMVGRRAPETEGAVRTRKRPYYAADSVMIGPRFCRRHDPGLSSCSGGSHERVLVRCYRIAPPAPGSGAVRSPAGSMVRDAEVPRAAGGTSSSSRGDGSG